MAELDVETGDVVPFVLTWHPSHVPAPEPVDAVQAVAGTGAWSSSAPPPRW